MANISLLSRLVNGVQRQVDLSTNTLVVGDITLGGLAGTNLSKAILDRLIVLQNGTDVDATYHTHDTLYYRKAALNSTTPGNSGADHIGDGNTYVNITPAATTVEAALLALDAASGGATTAVDSTFRIVNTGDPTKKIAFSAAGITTGTVRTITMPDADVNLGKVNTAIQKDGSVTYIANQPMGSNKLTGLSAGSGAGDSVRYEQAILISGANAFTANQSMGGNKLTSLAAASANGDAVRFEQAVLTDGSHPITGDQSFSGTAKITNLVDPTLAQDGATKAYVDNSIAGLSWKQAARVSSVANLNLASMPAAVDGVTLANGERFLAKDQTTASQNGIYVFNGAGSAATRSTDADTWNEIVAAVIYIEEGSVGAGGKWVNINVSGGTLGTTAVAFTTFAAASALDGVGTAGYNAYWTAAHTLAAEQYVAASRGGLATDASAFSGVVKASVGVFSASLIVNADIAAGAAIAYSKLNLSNSIVNADIAAGAAIAYSKLVLTASIVNADIAAGAAIVYSKLSLTNSIVNADIASGAAIAYSKLALTNSIVLGDLTSNSVDENKIVSTALDSQTMSGGSGAKLAVIQAPQVGKQVVAGEAFAANTSFAVRWGMNSLSESTDRVYKADQDASSFDKFWVIGMVLSTSSISAGQSINLYALGSFNIGSSDSSFSSGDVGKPLWLTSAGAFSSTSPSTSNNASSKIGMIESTTKIWIAPQMMGVN